MNYRDLWNDTLDEALPQEADAAAHQAMQGAARRARVRRRIFRAAACGACFALAAIFMLHERNTPPQQTPPATASIDRPAPAALSDADLISRLEEAGFGIIIAGPENHRQLLLVSHEGGIFQP
jgi:bacterioferritin-associated ferredoxin